MADEKDIKPHAIGEWIIIESIARPAGYTETTSAGIVLGTAQIGEIPLSGVVVSVGDKVPEYYKSFVGKEVVLPQGLPMRNVPNLAVIKKLTKDESIDVKRVAVHYSNIYAFY